jgi:hypothetical protein
MDAWQRAAGLRTPERARYRPARAPPPTPSSVPRQSPQQRLQQQFQQQQLQRQQFYLQQQQQLQMQIQQGQQDKQQQQETKPPPLQLTRSRFASLLVGEHAVVDVEALRRDAELETGKVLFIMKRQKRKDVWHFVRLVRKDECWEIARKDCLNVHADWAHCLLCNVAIKFKVGKSKVREHVEEPHPAELAVYQNQTQRRDVGESEPVIRNLANSFGRAADPDQKRPLRAVTAGEQKRVNELLA